MHKIKDMLMKELMKYEEKGNISMNSLDVIHKMTDTIKNIDKIEMLEEGGGYSEAMYSRDESKDMMMRKFDEMLGEAKTPAERETIKKCIETMENY